MGESVRPQWKTPSEIYTILYITMYTKAEFYNNCFIIHLKMFLGSLQAYFLVDLAFFLARFQDTNRCFFFLQILLKK